MGKNVVHIVYGERCSELHASYETLDLPYRSHPHSIARDVVLTGLENYMFNSTSPIDQKSSQLIPIPKDD